MKQIGRYEVMEEIGSGGMGTVYKARHPGLGKIVAVKVLSAECGRDADLVARFEREARIMADLPDYRHVVQVYDAGNDGGRYWYAMEYIPGSLADYLGEPDAEKTRVSSLRVLEVNTAVDIARQVLSGLEVIHGAGVIHRDLCPQNIVLKTERPAPMVKITDFGIAGKKGGKLTKTGMWGGHEYYAAPEPWSESNASTDLYSLGVLLYRMVTGRNPAGRFKDPGVLNTDVGPALNECILTCMEQEPEDRYQSASDMRRVLEQVLRGEQEPSPAVPPSGSDGKQSVPSVSGISVSDPPARVTSSIGMEFVYIEPGTFMMGSHKDEPERSDDEILHRVTLTRGYYLQTTPVTQAQWKTVMGDNPSHFKGDDLPVEEVSWDDAQEFIQKLNRRENITTYRLPTEAEWEYACRAGTDTPFFFGRCLGTDQANYDGNNPLEGCPKGERRRKTTPVKMFTPNAWGLYDMHGNVREWCSDWYGSYPSSSVTDPTGPPDGALRVFRGGSWSIFAQYCRSAYRDHSSPGGRHSSLGFRLARNP